MELDFYTGIEFSVVLANNAHVVPFLGEIFRFFQLIV